MPRFRLAVAKRVEILPDSDLAELAEETRHRLGKVLTAVSGNRLLQMQKDLRLPGRHRRRRAVARGGRVTRR